MLKIKVRKVENYLGTLTDKERGKLDVICIINEISYMYLYFQGLGIYHKIEVERLEEDAFRGFFRIPAIELKGKSILTVCISNGVVRLDSGAFGEMLPASNALELPKKNESTNVGYVYMEELNIKPIETLNENYYTCSKYVDVKIEKENISFVSSDGYSGVKVTNPLEDNDDNYMAEFTVLKTSLAMFCKMFKKASFEVYDSKNMLLFNFKDLLKIAIRKTKFYEQNILSFLDEKLPVTKLNKYIYIDGALATCKTFSKNMDGYAVGLARENLANAKCAKITDELSKDYIYINARIFEGLLKKIDSSEVCIAAEENYIKVFNEDTAFVILRLV